MQTQEAARVAAKGVRTAPRRSRRLEVLLTFVAVLATFAVMAWLTPDYSPVTSGADDANFKPGAGTAVVHDDAGNMPLELRYPLPHGKVVNTGAVLAVVHDDAGNMPGGVGSAIVHDDAGSVKLQ